MVFFPSICRRLSMAFIVAMGLSSAVMAAPDHELVVAAIASDVRAVVIRDAMGRLTVYGVGETVQGTGWRVTGVYRREAVLRNLERFGGATLEMHARVGQKLNPGNDAVETRSFAAQPAAPQ
jgi:hypothetical protein